MLFVRSLRALHSCEFCLQCWNSFYASYFWQILDFLDYKREKERGRGREGEGKKKTGVRGEEIPSLVSVEVYLFLPLVEKGLWGDAGPPAGTNRFIWNNSTRIRPCLCVPWQALQKRSCYWEEAKVISSLILQHQLTGAAGREQQDSGGLLHPGKSHLQQGSSTLLLPGSEKHARFMLYFICSSVPFLLIIWVLGLYMAGKCNKRKPKQ